MSPANDTIAAIATPPGKGGIGVVRVSGPQVPEIARRLVGELPAPRTARHTIFRDAAGEPLDDGLVLYFPEPRSFTGEHVLELQGHGGAVVLERVLRACLAAGARMARPGEFSERAFLNGKLDLAQAEAVADLIEAGTEQGARAALRSLQGEFSRRVHQVVEALIELRMYIEAAIDFPEEEVDFLADASLLDRHDRLLRGLADLEHRAHRGQLLRDGLQVVIVGRPNAGKSSLLNALAGRERAIVTAVPGTTRDTIHESIQIEGVPLVVVDTAGLRESEDRVEQMGVERARAAMEEADLILLVVDDSASEQPLPEGIDLSDPRLRVVINKIDRTGREPGASRWAGREAVALSARTGAGMESLHRLLRERSLGGEAGEGAFIARRRHLEALARAEEHIRNSRRRLAEEGAGELAAEELRLAQQALGEITGEFTSDDLLGRIFTSFCIGK